MAPSDDFKWFAYTLGGDETAAREAGRARCKQISQGLEQSQSVSDDTNQPEKRYFTVDLFQESPLLTVVASSVTGSAPGNWTVKHDPMLVNFPLDDEALASKMKAELDDIYAVNGTQGLDDLQKSIDDAGSLHIRNLDEKEPVSFANPTKFASDTEVLDAASKVTGAYRLARDALSKTIAAAQKEIQGTAKVLAIDQLASAANEITKEAGRYIQGMGELGYDAIGAALQSGKPKAQTTLNASGVAPLIGALRKIATRKDALDAASRSLAEKSLPAQLKALQVQQDLWLATAPSPGDIVPVFDGLSQAEVKQMFPAESGAVEDAARALQIEVGVQCRALPVLFRIWKSNEIPSSVTFTVQPDGTYKVMATTAAGGTAIATLTASLHDTLVTAYASNLSFASSIDGDASYVWRYPPLIDRALAQLQYSDPSVEVRAAQERLEAEGGMDAPTAASMAASSIELAAVAFAAAPEVLAVLAAITLIANAVSSIAEFAKTLQSDRAFDAVLDPDRAVASRPSYLGTVVNVVATLLDVKGFMGAARTAAYAREVPAVDKAVTAILP